MGSKNKNKRGSKRQNDASNKPVFVLNKKQDELSAKLKELIQSLQASANAEASIVPGTEISNAQKAINEIATTERAARKKIKIFLDFVDSNADLKDLMGTNDYAQLQKLMIPYRKYLDFDLYTNPNDPNPRDFNSSLDYLSKLDNEDRNNTLHLIGEIQGELNQLMEKYQLTGTSPYYVPPTYLLLKYKDISTEVEKQLNKQSEADSSLDLQRQINEIKKFREKATDQVAQTNYIKLNINEETLSQNDDIRLEEPSRIQRLRRFASAQKAKAPDVAKQYFIVKNLYNEYKLAVEQLDKNNDGFIHGLQLAYNINQKFNNNTNNIPTHELVSSQQYAELESWKSTYLNDFNYLLEILNNLQNQQEKLVDKAIAAYELNPTNKPSSTPERSKLVAEIDNHILGDYIKPTDSTALSDDAKLTQHLQLIGYFSKTTQNRQDVYVNPHLFEAILEKATPPKVLAKRKEIGELKAALMLTQSAASAAAPAPTSAARAAPAASAANPQSATRAPKRRINFPAFSSETTGLPTDGIVTSYSRQKSEVSEASSSAASSSQPVVSMTEETRLIRLITRSLEELSTILTDSEHDRKYKEQLEKLLKEFDFDKAKQKNQDIALTGTSTDRVDYSTNLHVIVDKLRKLENRKVKLNTFRHNIVHRYERIIVDSNNQRLKRLLLAAKDAMDSFSYTDTSYKNLTKNRDVLEEHYKEHMRQKGDTAKKSTNQAVQRPPIPSHVRAFNDPNALLEKVNDLRINIIELNLPQETLNIAEWANLGDALNNLSHKLVEKIDRNAVTTADYRAFSSAYEEELTNFYKLAEKLPNKITQEAFQRSIVLHKIEKESNRLEQYLERLLSTTNKSNDKIQQDLTGLQQHKAMLLEPNATYFGKQLQQYNDKMAPLYQTYSSAVADHFAAGTDNIKANVEKFIATAVEGKDPNKASTEFEVLFNKKDILDEATLTELENQITLENIERIKKFTDSTQHKKTQQLADILANKRHDISIRSAASPAAEQARELAGLSSTSPSISASTGSADQRRSTSAVSQESPIIGSSADDHEKLLQSSQEILQAYKDMISKLDIQPLIPNSASYKLSEIEKELLARHSELSTIIAEKMVSIGRGEVPIDKDLDNIDKLANEYVTVKEKYLVATRNAQLSAEVKPQAGAPAAVIALSADTLAARRNDIDLLKIDIQIAVADMNKLTRSISLDDYDFDTLRKNSIEAIEKLASLQINDPDFDNKLQLARVELATISAKLAINSNPLENFDVTATNKFESAYTEIYNKLIAQEREAFQSGGNVYEIRAQLAQAKLGFYKYVLTVAQATAKKNIYDATDTSSSLALNFETFINDKHLSLSEKLKALDDYASLNQHAIEELGFRIENLTLKITVNKPDPTENRPGLSKQGAPQPTFGRAKFNESGSDISHSTGSSISTQSTSSSAVATDYVALATQLKNKVGIYDIEPTVNGKSAADILGDKGYKELLGKQADTSKSAREKFIDALVTEVLTNTNTDIKDLPASANDATVTLKKLFNDDSKLLKLYQDAVNEEKDSHAFKEAVFIRATEFKAGPSWKNRMILWVAGPSASGKSFVKKSVLEQAETVMEKKKNENGNDEENGNYIVSIDGGIERETCQMRQLVLQAALQKGYSGINGLDKKTQLGIKSNIERAALASENNLNLVIPNTFTRGHKKLIEHSKLLNTVNIFSEVVSKKASTDQDVKTAAQRFQETVGRMGNSRAWSSSFGKPNNRSARTLQINNLNIGSESKKYGAGNFAAGLSGSIAAANAYLDNTPNKTYITVTNDLIFVTKDNEANAEWSLCDASDVSQHIKKMSQRQFDAIPNKSMSPDELDAWLKTDEAKTLGQPLVAITSLEKRELSIIDKTRAAALTLSSSAADIFKQKPSTPPTPRTAPSATPYVRTPSASQPSFPMPASSQAGTPEYLVSKFVESVWMNNKTDAAAYTEIFQAHPSNGALEQILSYNINLLDDKNFNKLAMFVNKHEGLNTPHIDVLKNVVEARIIGMQIRSDANVMKNSTMSGAAKKIQEQLHVFNSASVQALLLDHRQNIFITPKNLTPSAYLRALHQRNLNDFNSLSATSTQQEIRLIDQQIIESNIQFREIITQIALANYHALKTNLDQFSRRVPIDVEAIRHLQKEIDALLNTKQLLNQKGFMDYPTVVAGLLTAINNANRLLNPPVVTKANPERQEALENLHNEITASITWIKANRPENHGSLIRFDEFIKELPDIAADNFDQELARLKNNNGILIGALRSEKLPPALDPDQSLSAPLSESAASAAAPPEESRARAETIFSLMPAADTAPAAPLVPPAAPTGVNPTNPPLSPEALARAHAEQEQRRVNWGEPNPAPQPLSNLSKAQRKAVADADRQAELAIKAHEIAEAKAKGLTDAQARKQAEANARIRQQANAKRQAEEQAEARKKAQTDASKRAVANNASSALKDIVNEHTKEQRAAQLAKTKANQKIIQGYINQFQVLARDLNKTTLPIEEKQNYIRQLNEYLHRLPKADDVAFENKLKPIEAEIEPFRKALFENIVGANKSTAAIAKAREDARTRTEERREKIKGYERQYNTLKRDLRRSALSNDIKSELTKNLDAAHREFPNLPNDVDFVKRETKALEVFNEIAADIRAQIDEANRLAREAQIQKDQAKPNNGFLGRIKQIFNPAVNARQSPPQPPVALAGGGAPAGGGVPAGGAPVPPVVGGVPAGGVPVPPAGGGAPAGGGNNMPNPPVIPAHTPLHATLLTQDEVDLARDIIQGLDRYLKTAKHCAIKIELALKSEMNEANNQTLQEFKDKMSLINDNMDVVNRYANDFALDEADKKVINEINRQIQRANTLTPTEKLAVFSDHTEVISGDNAADLKQKIDNFVQSIGINNGFDAYNPATLTTINDNGALIESTDKFKDFTARANVMSFEYKTTVLRDVVRANVLSVQESKGSQTKTKCYYNPKQLNKLKDEDLLKLAVKLVESHAATNPGKTIDIKNFDRPLAVKLATYCALKGYDFTVSPNTIKPSQSDMGKMENELAKYATEIFGGAAALATKQEDLLDFSDPLSPSKKR